MQMNDSVSHNRITKQLELFKQLLHASFPYLDWLMQQHNWDDDMDLFLDWVQVNWELLVERELLGKGKYLTPLSVPLATRVTNESAQPNYSISTHISNDIVDLRTSSMIPKNTPLRFFGFCTVLEKGFGFYPPFDLANLVLDSTKELFIAPFSQLKFYLVKWT